jgi:hypothetical protein
MERRLTSEAPREPMFFAYLQGLLILLLKVLPQRRKRATVGRSNKTVNAYTPVQA